MAQYNFSIIASKVSKYGMGRINVTLSSVDLTLLNESLLGYFLFLEWQLSSLPGKRRNLFLFLIA